MDDSRTIHPFAYREVIPVELPDPERIRDRQNVDNLNSAAIAIREMYLARLLFAARSLAMLQIRDFPAGVFPPQRFCHECQMIQRAGGCLDHDDHCQVGQVLNLIDTLVSHEGFPTNTPAKTFAGDPNSKKGASAAITLGTGQVEEPARTGMNGYERLVEAAIERHGVCVHDCANCGVCDDREAASWRVGEAAGE